ncbi:hypothetical protein [Methylobacterium oxalidis]|uniref:PilZ domain-containing protein n=1 Tax=Methylobacterium oxalidis TaxID=944322 RepID=A0A512JD25_9HYPH|nr:hypothetical protein [Methylobacterium oxalidis]GEP07839.1 hypothetical protein MOX02_58770 [Methylobacterium oxalidis]GJE35837.1 hypothetical protein LDDCCGHA_6058 [Methylobacterium oxalidis]GLS65016.1 hypothetical protein GCM10007888_33970 [Methylobacterium oxalidis]
MQKAFGSTRDELFRSALISTFQACAVRGRPAVRHFRETPTAYEREAGISDATEASALTDKPGALSTILCRIRLWNGCAFECALSERTRKGARLLLGQPSRIPCVFTLEIGEEPEQVPARVAWRRRNEIGIEFLEVV